MDHSKSFKKFTFNVLFIGAIVILIVYITALLKLIGSSDDKKLTIIGASQIELKKLPLNTFDIIYIDGSHSAGDVLEDAILTMRILKTGGLLIFDDYGYEDKHFWIKVATAVDTFYQFYHDKFKVIQRGWLVILEKTASNEN